MTVIYLLTFVLFVAYVGYLASRITRRSLSEWIITSFLLFAGSVIFTGFVLSALYQTAHTPVWAIAVFITATLFGRGLHYLVVNSSPDKKHTPFSPTLLIRERRRQLIRWYRALNTFAKVIFGILFVTLGIIAVMNLILVLFTAPNEWDSMTGHLNRVVQYIQRGSMRHFGGTNWNIDTYPKSVCTLQIYGYLITGHFENGFKLIHHLSYWIAIVSVFGIVQRITNGRLSASLLCALGYALLPDFLMQAITTETDIVLTAYLSVVLYMLFTFRQTGDNRYLYLTAMAFAIAFGHKITFALLLPSVFVIMVYTVFLAPGFRIFLGRTFRLGIAIVIAMCFWTFPTGYLKNIEVFGHPIGPPTALKHQSVERAGSLRNLFEQGSRNVVRYGYDHINLDGIRNVEAGVVLNHEMRKPLVFLEDKLRMRLDEETDFSIQPFSFDRRFIFYNANPYWGIIGFGLIFPILLLVLSGIIGVPVARSTPHAYLGIALLLHFAALSYSAPYDPFKGRYFIETGLFGIPMLALLFSNTSLSVDRPGRWLWKGYVGMVLVGGCISALLCVFFNTRALPFDWHTPDGRDIPSVFNADRMRVLTLGRPDIYRPYKRFDELVPEQATVALGTINDDYEYPLYGKDLTRRLIAINPFERGVQPIPKEADYLFFAKSVIKPRPGDIRLGTDTTMTEANGIVVPGEDYYLRKLK
ncbi:ArnT family glycosyltransferase [Arsenicibacter rosenii]|uniref:Glycosyltransferase RgtA/B/C/D-like domain-containing protein n=1 Tax=Arsenicibacter rosenii TaxID=1750698 RepID=A0A1S2VPV7_9BACT|nr:glycosyltransferase family 39 protein [Arsenicibacter rosenii]OIN60784.1 hypothetical protein BLX24_01410 [Arsenicibacter rosenii]